MDNDLWRQSLHEAGHLVVGAAFGMTAGAASVEGTPSWGGCAICIPRPVEAAAVAQVDPARPGVFVQWNGLVRARIEAETCLILGGDMAAELFEVPRTGRTADPEPETVEAPGSFRELPPPTEAERSDLAAIMAEEDSMTEDVVRIDELCRIAHGYDLESRAAWVRYLERQTRAILVKNADRVRFVALALAEEGTLGAEAVAGLLADRP